MAESTESFIRAEAEGHTWERQPPRPQDDHLLAHTVNWLGALPKGVRPIHLQQDFPRIVNELARLWDETPALDRYFEDKEFSRRADRSGFPAMVKEELLALHVHSLRSRPVPYELRARQRSLQPG